MKQKIIPLLIAILFSSFAGYSVNIPPISIEGAKALIVDIKDWKTKLLDVKIKNTDGDLVFNDELTMDNAKKFNFENLENGMYTVILADEFKTTTQSFNIKENKLALLDNLKTVYKPIITINNSSVDLNYMSDGSKTNVSIYDTNNAVFDVKIENETSINKRFNTCDLPIGTYTFYVTSNNKSYWKKFRK